MPQHLYQDNQYNYHGNEIHGKPVNVNYIHNAEPSPRDSHADANEEIQGYFPTPLPRKPHNPSSYMNVPPHQQRNISRYKQGSVKCFRN